MVKKVFIGKSFKDAIISKKKPARAIRIGSSQSYTRYAFGSKEYLVPKKGVELKRKKK